MTAFAEHARRLSELGWALIRTDGKDPVGKAWQKTTPGEPGFVAGQWAHWNGSYNMGVVLGTSGLVVFEYDDEQARERFFELLGGEVPSTPTCRTGSGKLHVYFADPGGLRKCSQDGLELRLGAHQCLVPPSLHPVTGEPYEWLHEPWEVALMPLPDDVLVFFTDARVRSGQRTIPEVITPGKRHESFVTVATTMRKAGIGEAAILHALRGVNNEQADPPKTDDEELVNLARDAMDWRVGRSIPTYTDLGNAELYAERNAHRLRYVKERRQWLQYGEGRWRLDRTGEAERAGKDVARELLRAAADLEDEEKRKKAVAWAMTSHQGPRLREMLSGASTERTVVLAVEELDREPYLLACANGTLDLRTGTLCTPDPADLISLGNDVPFVPDATAPRWERFLEEVFRGDADLIDFMRRMAGYALTGDTREQIVFVLHGSGGNGKDTFIKRITRLLGTGEHEGMAKTTPMETFARVRDRGVRNDLARLHRARLVVASESAEGRRLDEPTIKSVSGGNAIAARFLYGEFFEYVPQFKVWLVTNHRPRVEGDDDAIWRRLRLIPFDVSFVGREDKELDAKLEAELPGIFAWAVRGCLEWQSEGLGLPEAVERATSEYRADEDVLGTFIAEQCVLEGQITPVELRGAYERFCEGLGERPLSASVLGKRLSRRGIPRVMRDGLSVYLGIGLRP